MRYWYGELRLDRLNWIYRFRKFQYVYLSLDTSHVHYFSGWIPYILFVIAWVSIALTALQVLLAAKPEGQTYSRGSEGFAVTVLFLCIGWTGAAFLLLHTIMFGMQMVALLRYFSLYLSSRRPHEEWEHLV